MPGSRYAVLCLGNELHGDDGFGLAVGRALATPGLPAPWQLVQAGTRGLEALAALQDCEAAIVVDAAAPAGCPGRLRHWQPEQIALEGARADHGLGLGWVLRALQALQPSSAAAAPRMRILTAEMSAQTPFHIGLSPPVQAAVPAAAARLQTWMQERWDEPAIG